MSDVRARWVEFKQLSRALATASDEFVRLQMVVDSAPALVPGCDHAGLTLNAAGGVVTRVGSDDVVQQANEMQFELGECPCLDMQRDQDTLLSHDLSQDDRWPRWAKTVSADLGVHSMLSLLVFTDRESYGALSLYAGRVRGFDADAVAIGQGLAGHLALIMATSREIDQLGAGLHSRMVIGQATGLVMGRFDVDADHAFDYLRRVSSHSNTKIADVAAMIVRTRQLPEEY